MSLFIDVLLSSVFVFTVINNYRYGLFCSLLRMAKFFICLFAAYLLADGIVGYIAVFAVSFALLSILLTLLRKIRIPVITRADKILGLVLGVFLGLLYVSAISSMVFGAIELLSSAGVDCVGVYEDSTVFKFVYDIGFFDFIFSAVNAQT